VHFEITNNMQSLTLFNLSFLLDFGQGTRCFVVWIVRFEVELSQAYE